MLSTKQFANEIRKAENWDDLEQNVLKNLEKVTFGDRLCELCTKYKKKTSELQLECAISKSMFYAILSDKRAPSKHTVIKIAFALKTTKDELNELLKLAKHKELYKNKEDAIILFGLENDKDVYEIDEVLKQYGSNLRLTEEE